MFKTILILLALTICTSLQAWTCPKGKVDVGAAYIDIDVLESGKTVEQLHLIGVKADATVLVYKGWFIKPNIIWAANDGELVAGTFGIGHYYPLNDRLTLLPSVGYGFSYLDNKIKLETPFGVVDAKRRFHSKSPYISLEFSYKFAEKWYLMGYAQYAWSRCKTTLKHIFSDKSFSEGPNYGLGIEYSVNAQWSVTAGVAYNLSLSHEKHGLRAKGAKLGFSYYF